MARINGIDPQAFARRLQYYASIDGHDRASLSRELEVRWATVDDWWQGRVVPGRHNLQKLGEVFSVTLDDLLGVAEGQDPPFEAWKDFLETEQGRSASEEELTALRSIYWKGRRPNVASYLVVLQGIRSADPDS